ERKTMVGGVACLQFDPTVDGALSPTRGRVAATTQFQTHLADVAGVESVGHAARRRTHRRLAALDRATSGWWPARSHRAQSSQTKTQALPLAYGTACRRSRSHPQERPSKAA